MQINKVDKASPGILYALLYGLERDCLSIPFFFNHIELQVRLSCDSMPFGVSVKPSCLCMIHVIREKKFSI